jgi:hypothetical protein
MREKIHFALSSSHMHNELDGQECVTSPQLLKILFLHAHMDSMVGDEKMQNNYAFSLFYTNCYNAYLKCIAPVGVSLTGLMSLQLPHGLQVDAFAPPSTVVSFALRKSSTTRGGDLASSNNSVQGANARWSWKLRREGEIFSGSEMAPFSFFDVRSGHHGVLARRLNVGGGWVPQWLGGAVVGPQIG